MTKSSPRLTQSRVIVCEGVEDGALLNHMMDAGQIGPFDVSTIGDGHHDDGKGKDALGSHLMKLVGRAGFKDIHDIVILLDADEDEAAAFAAAKVAVEAANADVDVNGRYTVPDAAFIKKGGKISTTVMLLPGQGAKGCLETILWRVISQKYPKHAACVESLIQCAGVGAGAQAWGQSKLDKARVRAAVAILHKGNPAQALSRIWEKAPALIPTDGGQFSDLVQHLAAI
jgi:hypothetical protein